MKLVTRSIAVLVVLLGITLALATPAYASLDGKGNDVLTGIDETVAIDPGGHNATVTGHITCTDPPATGPTETVVVRVAVTQTTLIARAEGSWSRPCTGETQSWTVRASTGGPSLLDDAPVHVTAWAETWLEGARTDDHRWAEDNANLVAAEEIRTYTPLLFH